MRGSEFTEVTGWVQRFFTRAYSRASLPYLLAALLILIAIRVGGSEVGHHINAIEARISALGSWGLIAFIAVFVITTSLLVPDTVICMIAGALFGVYWGVVAVVVGSILAGSIQFILARRLLYNRIQRVLSAKPSLAAIQRAVILDEFRLQVLLRLTPLNPATLSYLLGAAGVRFSGFIIAGLAHIPGFIVEVYFGRVGKHAIRMAGGTVQITHLHDLALFGGLTLCIVVMVLISKAARKAVLKAVA